MLQYLIAWRIAYHNAKFQRLPNALLFQTEVAASKQLPAMTGGNACHMLQVRWRRRCQVGSGTRACVRWTAQRRQSGDGLCLSAAWRSYSVCCCGTNGASLRIRHRSQSARALPVGLRSQSGHVSIICVQVSDAAWSKVNLLCSTTAVSSRFETLK